MADVARIAGVSQQTVSRVVNSQPNVSERTRKRVLEAMGEVGFRPNYAGRSLRDGTYRAVGLCMFEITRAGNLATLNGIVTAAREHGYAVTMIEMGSDAPFSLAQASRRMAELPVDGIIINMNRVADDFEEFSPLVSLRTVLLTVYAHPRCSTVDSDQYGCSEMVVEYLMGHGHERIAYIAGPSRSVSAEFRRAGWRDTLLRHGIEPQEALWGDWSAESGYAAGIKIAQMPDVTAVYAANDQMAYGAMLALRACGRRVPEDVSVIGVDDALTGVVPNNMLTTVRFDLVGRGRAAFDLAVGDRASAIEAIRIPGTLVERSSVADIR